MSLTDYLSLTDLFLVGLAFDICGAVLLAKGLLLSPRMLAKLNTNWGVGYGQHRDRCENRVAAEFGVGYLILGFILQAIGYALGIGGVDSATGACRLAAGLLMAVGAGAVGWAGWELFRRPRLRSLETSIENERAAAKREIEEGKARKES